ncbi:hypothetical protein [Leptospira santarosai]|uniref:hypothetical protein n=1 Tax=Leptospira santarosai TaxID=28183 RepID=UPI000367E17E|nr:hypothetical protein [Leptospira santarosai]
MSKPKNRAEELVGNEVHLKQLKALVERAMITQRTPLYGNDIHTWKRIILL